MIPIPAYDVTRAVVLTGVPNRSGDDCACPEQARLLAGAGFLRDENDCACPSTPDLVQAGPRLTGLFARTAEVETCPLPGGFWMTFSPFAPAGPSALNPEAWERWQSFCAPQPLEYPVDQQLLEQNLIAPAGHPPRLDFAAPEALTVWLHVTNACNLDCPYCYVHKSSASMSLEVGRKTIDKLVATARQHGFRSVKIKYAGGEATLRMRLVRALVAYGRARFSQAGLALQHVLLSNGTHLAAPDADWLRDNQVAVMISLDGVGPDHDRTRHHRDGRGTFQAVAHTIDQVLLKRGIQPFVSITITRENAGRIAAAVRWALERDLPVSLNFFRRGLDGSLPASLAAEEDAIIQGMRAAYAVVEEMLPERPLLNGLLDRVQVEAHPRTCGIGQSYLVVNQEGLLAPCHMLLDHCLAESRDADWLDALSAGTVQNLPVDQKAECRTCAYRYRCAGGCPLETYQAAQRYDAPSPNCRIYRALFPEVLRLEGLRLMKSHGYL
ncbi:MAG: SPASM domain-containing protein [Anaerolineales bacterium]|nr:SPASM domain-containing protein [Anaerolineales bacterium]